MRILHTSDWHLGRSFHGAGLLDAQARFADHLIETVTSERVDLVLVSGDVYDRALPPVEAIELCDDLLARLAATSATTVLISGNHDSAIRLGFNARLAEAAGVHLKTRWQDVGKPVVVEDAHGPWAVHGIPYLEPDAVRLPWGLPERSHEAALRAALERVAADRSCPPGRSIVLAHAFVAGSAEAAPPMGSDSERDLSVGGVQIVPTALFSSQSYAALGHLHRPQVLTDSVRYSGSPLAYSFSEAGQTKGSWLVDLGVEGVTAAQLVEAPVPRPLAVLSGELEELLTSREHVEAEEAWVSITLTDAQRPELAVERLRARFPHLLTLSFATSPSSRARHPVMPHVTGRSDLDVALGFVHEVRTLEATSEEALLLQLACDSSRINADRDADTRVNVVG